MVSMKYLAVDYGVKRTGIAVSDNQGQWVFPRRTILMTTRELFFAELLALAEEEHIDAFVVGLPLYSDGSDSETTRIVRNMTSRLMRRTPLPVYFMEETLSSYEGEQALKASSKRGKNRTDFLDQAAAVAILTSFLSLPAERKIPL